MAEPPGPGMRGGAANDELALLQALLADEGMELPAEGISIVARKRPARVPLAFAQELLWLLDRASPGMTAYKMLIARRLEGVLDAAALERALRKVQQRHEALRTRFPAVDAEPVQEILPEPTVRLELIDLRGGGDSTAEATVRMRELAERPFDMTNEPLFRTTLLRIGDKEHVLLIETHHMVFDGWSRDLFFREIASCYGAFRRHEEPVLPPLAIQFADFALWQREHLSGERLEGLLGFWREQLGDISEPADLPTDRSRAASPGFVGAKTRALLGPELLASLKRLGRDHDATLYMVLLAVYMTVLHRYSGAEKVLVGSGSAGRTHPETESLIGYLNNTLVQRGDFAGDPSFATLLATVRESALGAYDHQEVPLEKLILELRDKEQRQQDLPLFQAVLTMQGTLDANFTLDDIVVSPFGVESGSTKFDLTLFPAESAEGLWLTLQYRSDLYEPATAGRLLGHLQRVLESAVANPATPVSRLSLLTDAERQQLADWNAASREIGGNVAVHRRVAMAAARTPDATAVVCGSEQCSYAALDRRANQLAHLLLREGVKTGMPVGILLDRSMDAITALLAVLKAGGCYVPLAPDVPTARLAQQLAECGASLVLTQQAYADQLPATVQALSLDTESGAIDGAPDTAPDVNVSLGDLAYILFTSGSTGVPKGVAVTHGNLANYTMAIRQVVGDDEAMPYSFATVSTLAADLGNTAIFPALTSGGTLHVLTSETTMDGPAFAAYGRMHSIDVLKITPSHLRALLSSAGSAAPHLLPRKWLVVGGEACPWELVDEVRRLGSCQVLNHYGPTETTVGASVFHAGRRDQEPLSATVPIGRPLPNVQLHVLDAAHQLVPIGIPGELHIGGAGVATGYLGQQALTDQRFLTIAGLGRVYATGDRARRLPDGALEFLGRGDGQIKVRGFRVELGEIEMHLREFPGVADAVVLPQPTGEGAAGEVTLVAYVVAAVPGYATAHSERPSAERLHDWLAGRLPDHMVPAHFLLLDSLPLNANGKLDRRALPLPSETGGASVASVAPSTATEMALATIWMETLKREGVGIRENFFDLGGHSLLAIRVLGKVSREFGVRLALRTLFETPTIEALAQRIDQERANPAAPAPSSVIKPVSRIPTHDPAGDLH